MHERGNYTPSDLLDVDEFKALVDETSELFTSTIKYSVSNTLKAYLEKDAFVFSGLRTHAQLVEARSYLKDESGNIRSYPEFEQKMLRLNAAYNQNYLQAEYNFAVQSGLSAEKWESFSDDEKRYYLQYRTAKDGKVRDAHLALDETTLPKSDTFWDSYMPPNGWNCRCTTVEVLADDYTKSDSKKAQEKGEKATTIIGKSGKNKAEMFRFNPGKEKKIFPPKNAYAPKHCKGGKVDMSRLIGMSAMVLNLEDDKCRVQKMLEEGFFYKNVGKGRVGIYHKVNKKANDFDNVKICCEFFAKQGADTRIFPKFDSTKDNNDEYRLLFAKLKGTPYWGKCPDLMVNNIFYEHEGFTTKNPKNAFSNMIYRGQKQSSFLIIEDSGMTDRWMKHNIHGRVKDGQKIDEVWIRRGNKLDLLYKKTEAQ